jgi:hypothetical protein
MRKPSYKADQHKQQSTRKIRTCHLTTRPSKRVTTQSTVAVETKTVKGFHPESQVEKVTTTKLPKGLPHPLAWPPLASDRRAFVRKRPSCHARFLIPSIVLKPGLPNVMYELSLLKHRQHHDPSPLAPCHPHDQKAEPSPLPCRSL